MKIFYFQIFLLLSQLILPAQKVEEVSAPQYLSLKHTVASDINPYKQDVYRLKLNKGQFAAIRVKQKNIGLAILVYDPLDSLLQIADENGIGQNEVITIHALTSGDYKLKVIWNFNPPLSGQYEIALDKIEQAGITVAQKAQQLFNSWYENNAPGGAVLVIKNNQVVFKQAKGQANVEENIPLTTSSVFEIASCSKQFTAFAIAMLIDQKKISLDDDIRNYITEMPDYGEKITIADLVYHTSGIRSTDVLEMAGFTPEDIITLPMVVKFAANQKHLKFKPGEKFNYSNTNYNLLAEIVARVTKQPFSSWTKENIFKPLGMNATFFKEDPGYVYGHKVLCYKTSKDVFIQRPNNYAATGSAALCTSIDDMVKWMKGLDTKQLITKNMETLLGTTGHLTNGSKTQYAFGNFIEEYRGFKKIEHLGLVIGYRTAIARFPDQKVSVIYFSNDDNNATYQRFYKIRDMFLGVGPQKPDLKGMPDANDMVAKLEKKEIETISLAEYEGIYFSSELNSALPLVIKDKKLVIVHPRMNDIILSKGKDDNFGFIQFSRDASRKVNALTVLGENIEFTKIEK